MNEALRTLEGLMELVHQEIKRVSNDRMVDEKSYALLREAGNDALTLKRKIADARAWNIPQK